VGCKWVGGVLIVGSGFGGVALYRSGECVPHFFGGSDYRNEFLNKELCERFDGR